MILSTARIATSNREQRKQCLKVSQDGGDDMILRTSNFRPFPAIKTSTFRRVLFIPEWQTR